jgi:hypothetical protein
VVKPQPSKLVRWVRFPSPAFAFCFLPPKKKAINAQAPMALSRSDIVDRYFFFFAAFFFAAFFAFFFAIVTPPCN